MASFADTHRTTPFLQSTSALIRRWWWRYRREPAGLVVSLIQPAIWLLVFGNLFRDATFNVTSSYIAFMTAGVVVMTVFNSALSGGVAMLFDRETGVLQRLLATPITPLAIICSRVVFVLGVTMLQVLIIIGLAYLLGVGIASGLLGLVLILLIGMLLGVGIAMVSMSLALGLRGHTQFFTILEFVSLPFLFASSALVPIEHMPAWLRWIALANPLTYAIDGVRSLILVGFDWQVLLTILGVILVFDCITMLIWWLVMRTAKV